MYAFVISVFYFIMLSVPYKKRWLMWQDSNLQYFNYESEILSISQIFFVIQMYINKILNM